MSDQFYRAFEDKYRGTRGLIKSRLQVYLPFVKPLKLKNPQEQIKAIDLGCGRGEWLELLTEEGGFLVHGVDLDQEMLKVAKLFKLQVTQQDAVQFLKSLPDESQAIVSGFHLAEHISFTELQELIKQALRVLQPAGLLILETPNAENLAVGTVNFYLDPTHNRPIPAQLMTFIPSFYGFKRTKIIRLQETLDLVNRPNEVGLIDIINGVSPDYAVIAQKAAEAKQMCKFDAAFNKQYGITVEQVAKCYEDNIESKIEAILVRAQAAEAKTQAAEAKTQAAEAKTQAAEAKTQAAEAKTQAAEAKTQAAEAKVYSMLNSKSWRITLPLRGFMSLFKKS